MKYSLFDKIPHVTCIYKITNKINNKSIIGSTKDLNKRINHYRNDIKKDNPLRHYNKDFFEDIIFYGLNSFYLEIIETFTNISDIELKNKESYYITFFDTLNNGYNIRLDVDGKYICNNSTKLLKQQQLKQQWQSGIRDSHSSDMKNYWNNVNSNRRKQQSDIMKKNLTKYTYDIYDNNNNLIVKNGLYEDLKKLSLINVLAVFYKTTHEKDNKPNIIKINNLKCNFNKKKLNKVISDNEDIVVKFKNYRIIRHCIK